MKTKVKAKIFLILIITSAVLYSCFAEEDYAPVMMVDFSPPEKAELKVRDIRVRGFTLEWTSARGNEYGYEYAVAASYDGNVENYETALAHDNIIMDFTPDYMLSNTYRVTGLTHTGEYKIKLFVRAKNIEVSEYLTASAVLPSDGGARILNVLINGKEAVYDSASDTFSHYYFPGFKEDEYTATYRTDPGCTVYINGESASNQVIRLTPDEPLEVTVFNEATGAARDYIIYTGSRDNGLPIVMIDTGGRRIESRSRIVQGSMKIIDSAINPLGVGLYNGPIEIRGRGNSSWGMPKQGWSFSIPERTQFLDMAPSRTWLLIANYADKSLMRNYTAYEFSRELGAAFAPKMRFVDLILNGEYYGTYNLGERARIGEGRLDLPVLRADMRNPYELTGSYLLEVSHRWRLRGGENTFHSPHVRPDQFNMWGLVEGDTVIIRQPNPDNLSRSAFEYIRDYFNDVDDALFGDNFKDPEKGYRAYIDTASWVDWYLINEFYKQVDGDFRLSTYLYKPRGEKLHMGPVWDFDLGAGNADYRSCDDPEGWYVRTSIWHSRLFEDEAFALEFKDRWNYLKANGYFDRFFKRIDDTADMLRQSAEMNFKRWPNLGMYVWPNANNPRDRTTYQDEIDYLKDWMKRRFEWMDREINK